MLTLRKGEMVSYETEEDGWVKVVMLVPATGLIGNMAGEFKNDIHGAGVSSVWLHGLAWVWPLLIFYFICLGRLIISLKDTSLEGLLIGPEWRFDIDSCG